MAEKYADMTCDIAIVGCGVAGLYAALNAPSDARIVMLSKGSLDECDSMLAQGGVCVLPEAQDYDSFFEDTLTAGHGENRRESVDIMIRSSRAVINDLIALGADFEREEDGSLAFTREGAHARARIAFHADVTGKEITEALLAAVKRLPNVAILEHVAMVDLILEDGAGAEDGVGTEDGAGTGDGVGVEGPLPGCCGIVAMPVSEAASTATIEELRAAAGYDGEPVSPGICGETGKPFAIRAANTLLATGGIGGVYQHSTNFPQLTGDACFLASAYGVAQEHLEYVQIHPTGLYSAEPGRTFLVSESCRGEGAVLLNHAGERFTDELQPRDVVARAIQDEMRDEGVEHEWLSFAPVNPQVVTTHFANIRAHCLEEGRDILTDPIPVVPTQHYFMGGVRVDRDSATSMPRLYAAGETACNGVHGKNRLASNSLLESLVFARRAAWKMATGESLPVEDIGAPMLDGVHRAPGELFSGLPDFELNIDTLL